MTEITRTLICEVCQRESATVKRRPAFEHLEMQLCAVCTLYCNVVAEEDYSHD